MIRNNSTVDRRTVIKTGGLAAMLSLTGCLGDGRSQEQETHTAQGWGGIRFVEHGLARDGEEIAVTGGVENAETADYEFVGVSVGFYDDEGVRVEWASDGLDNLSSGEQRAFETNSVEIDEGFHRYHAAITAIENFGSD